jgi:hypothetical protein
VIGGDSDYDRGFRDGQRFASVGTAGMVILLGRQSGSTFTERTYETFRDRYRDIPAPCDFDRFGTHFHTYRCVYGFWIDSSIRGHGDRARVHASAPTAIEHGRFKTAMAATLRPRRSAPRQRVPLRSRPGRRR